MIQKYFSRFRNRLKNVRYVYEHQTLSSFCVLMFRLSKDIVLHQLFVFRYIILYGYDSQIPFKAIPSAKPVQNSEVTILIPFRDQAHLLETCIKSIFSLTQYKNYRILLINNRSTEPETFKYLDTLKKLSNVRILDYDKPFNYAGLHNWAMDFVETEFVLFLNNDTSVIGGSWLESLLSLIEQENVGAVGGLLLYPDGTVQHAGVSFFGGLPFHIFSKQDPKGYYSTFINSVQEFSAVTGACLMTKKSLYKKVGGLDGELFPVTYNDIDYCLKLKAFGYKILYTPHALLYHHESASRGYDWIDIDKQNRARLEQKKFTTKWKGFRDPYLSPRNHLLQRKPD